MRTGNSEKDKVSLVLTESSVHDKYEQIILFQSKQNACGIYSKHYWKICWMTVSAFPLYCIRSWMASALGNARNS
jgi:hypothetical protein